MSDTTDAPATPAPAETPATPAFDPTAFEAKIASLIEERVKGFQRMVSEKDSRITELERELKTASMSEEEREQLTIRERQEADEALRLENALLKLGQQYPNEVAAYQKILERESVEDQIAALHEVLSAGKTPQPEPEQEVSDVDRNRPPATPVSAQSTQDMIRLPSGEFITREAGLELLRQAQSLS